MPELLSDESYRSAFADTASRTSFRQIITISVL